MIPKRKRRLYLVIYILSGVSLAVSLVIYALGQNVNLYFTPSQWVKASMPPQREVRLGGMVKKGSFKRQPNSLQVSFIVTDYKQEVLVQYTGILPALFKEGKGVVVQGKRNAQGYFIADQVLAKHDEKYMPPSL
jgi:cytochrome c-type biogenesis protein CcmE